MSLIVTTYTEDRLGNIAHLLESVQKQTLQNIEVIFVGEGTPHLCDQARALALSRGIHRFEALFNPGRPGLSSARNIGVTQADGDILAFVDDDVVLFPDWAEKLQKAFIGDDSVIGVTGSALPLWEDSAMAWLPEEFYWLISCTGWFDGRRGSPLRNAWGMNMAFRREAFAHAMFDEGLGGNRGSPDGSKLGLLGEDAAFSFRVHETMRGRIVYDPDVKVYHKVSRYRLTPRYVSRRAFWEGYTKATLHRESPFHGATQRGPEQRLVWRILLKFLPRTFARLFFSPRSGARRLAFAMGTLSYVVLGYTSGRFTLLGKLTRPHFER